MKESLKFKLLMTLNRRKWCMDIVAILQDQFTLFNKDHRLIICPAEKIFSQEQNIDFSKDFNEIDWLNINKNIQPSDDDIVITCSDFNDEYSFMNNFKTLERKFYSKDKGVDRLHYAVVEQDSKGVSLVRGIFKCDGNCIKFAESSIYANYKATDMLDRVQRYYGNDKSSISSYIDSVLLKTSKKKDECSEQVNQ